MRRINMREATAIGCTTCRHSTIRAVDGIWWKTLELFCNRHDTRMLGCGHGMMCPQHEVAVDKEQGTWN